MTTPKGILIAAVLTALLAAACGDGSGDLQPVAEEENAEQLAASYVNPGATKEEVFEPAVPAEMAGAWILVTVDGEPVPKVGKQPMMEISDDGTVSGVGGVNRFNTQVEVVDGRLSFGPTAATKMAGPPEAMDLESVFFARLGAVSNYETDGETLRLWAGDNEALVFVRPED